MPFDYERIKTDEEIAALGEKDAERILRLQLHPDALSKNFHAKGIDAVDSEGKRYEIKARAVRTIKIGPWKKSKTIEHRKDPYNLALYKLQPIRDNFDFLIVMKYNEFGKLLQMAKLAKADVEPLVGITKGMRYLRLSIVNDRKAMQIPLNS